MSLLSTRWMSKNTMKSYLEDLEKEIQRIKGLDEEKIGERNNLVAAKDRIKSELERREAEQN